MDQPGNGHFTLHMNQQTLNGRGGYHGRADYDGNGHAASGNNGNGQGANGYNGYAAAPNGGQQGHPDQQAGGQQVHGGPRGYAEYAEYTEYMEASAGQDASAETGTGQEASVDNITEGGAARGSVTEGRAPDQAIQDGALADGDADDRGAAEGKDAAILVPPQSGSRHDDASSDSAQHDTAPTGSAADRMRELLARSTAGHAASERATSTALEEIQRRLAGVERVVAELRDRAGAEPDIVARVAEQIAPQAQRLAGLSATLDGVSAGMSTVSTQLAAVDGRLTGIDSRLGSNDAKHASTEGRVSALDTRFERLDERLDDQYDRVSSIDNRLAAADSRIAGLGGQFAESLAPLAEEVRARPGRTEIEELVTKVVENVHADLATRLSCLEDTVLTLAEALLRPAPGHTPPRG
jgi:hypothetical protein